MPGRARTGIVALCCVQFVDVLGVTVVITALPTMMIRDLGGSASATSLVVTGYAMFFGGLLALGAPAQLGTALGVGTILLVAALAGGHGDPAAGAGAGAGWAAAAVFAVLAAGLTAVIHRPPPAAGRSPSLAGWRTT